MNYTSETAPRHKQRPMEPPDPLRMGKVWGWQKHYPTERPQADNICACVLKEKGNKIQEHRCITWELIAYGYCICHGYRWFTHTWETCQIYFTSIYLEILYCTYFDRVRQDVSEIFLHDWWMWHWWRVFHEIFSAMCNRPNSPMESRTVFIYIWNRLHRTKIWLINFLYSGDTSCHYLPFLRYYAYLLLSSCICL